MTYRKTRKKKNKIIIITTNKQRSQRVSTRFLGSRAEWTTVRCGVRTVRLGRGSDVERPGDGRMDPGVGARPASRRSGWGRRPADGVTLPRSSCRRHRRCRRTRARSRTCVISVTAVTRPKYRRMAPAPLSSAISRDLRAYVSGYVKIFTLPDATYGRGRFKRDGSHVAKFIFGGIRKNIF